MNFFRFDLAAFLPSPLHCGFNRGKNFFFVIFLLYNFMLVVGGIRNKIELIGKLFKKRRI